MIDLIISFSTSVLSELPNEIWLIVFRYVTTPGHHLNALNTTLADPMADYHDLHNHWYSSEGANLRLTKHYITLVSWKWRILSTPLLYERVILKSSAQFYSLERTLLTSPSSPGRYIKALCTSEAKSKTFSASSSKFMELVPNLKVFAHLQPGSIGDILNFSNLSVLPRITSFTFRATGLSSTLFCRALALLGPTLEILDVSFNTLIAEGSSLILLPVLHTLILGMNIGDGFQAFQLGFIARRWYTPNLKYIHGLDDVNGILSLGLGVGKGDCDLSPQSGVRTVVISRRDFYGNIGDTFPLLEDLVLDCSRPIMFRSPIPSCTRVGITLPFWPTSDDQPAIMERNRHYVGLLWDQFIPLMNPSTLPSLKTVRIFFKQPGSKTSPSTTTRNISAFSREHEFRVFWEHWVNRWKTRGVVLEAVQDGVVAGLDHAQEGLSDVDKLAQEYERIWERGSLGESSEDSSGSSRSSEGSDRYPSAMSLRAILQQA